MNDTSPAIEEKMREMIRRKTPEERFKMGCSMYDFSKHLVTRAILEKRPGLSLRNLRQELFLRFYGEDFDPSIRQRILDHLARLSDGEKN